MEVFRRDNGHARLWLSEGWSLSFLLMMVLLFFSLLTASGQYKTDRLLLMGRSALYYEDYVLSIQYFNQAIQAKAYLYEPWYYRAAAKYYLEDFRGAESDCSEAISRNPYVTGIYELRGLCRIQQKHFSDAISDYDSALRYDPENIHLWHNRALCRIQQKEYDAALADIDTMIARWSRHADLYSMQAEALLLRGDTARAITALEQSLALDAYDGRTWAQRSNISMARGEWQDAEGYLDKAIHLLPRRADLYINRALARVNRNNLRGAMADYDVALDFEPNNFLGHYNRGLLRAQVGDDNRAITDFDFVLKLEPDNMMALYNRGLLLENTGNPRAAIADYSKVIEEYPNFWAGLHQRASCYRKLGMTRQAELDEYRILKAQIDKRMGRQPRLSKSQRRKRSDEDIEKYNQLAVADEQELQQEYQSEYRGKVQNHRASMDYQPMYILSFEANRQQQGMVVPAITYDRQIDSLNRMLPPGRQLYIVSSQPTLSEQQTQHYFSLIDELSQQISSSAGLANSNSSSALGRQSALLLLQRAMAYFSTRNFESAIDDLSSLLQTDSLCGAAYWLRAVCQSRLNDFNASQGTDVRMLTANVLSDFTEALRQDENAYLYYNRANVYIQRRDYTHAIDDYTRAIALDAHMAEAFFNRGLAHLALKHPDKATADLSKAGELGLFTAYSIIKQQLKEIEKK